MALRFPVGHARQSKSEPDWFVQAFFLLAPLPFISSHATANEFPYPTMRVISYLAQLLVLTLEKEEGYINVDEAAYPIWYAGSLQDCPCSYRDAIPLSG
ncbi:uncharacterized protein RSE6_00121 [Rhynchosporium secalis]|uniref:Uncharacterized protein n=1 Tax=Rhynchosporium secalis TaxID=38038 RepID=A0A1E1LUG9_RHYSE|nr:uncharacterized protein RSE6_00121 [Rhynchosporium secalis]